jgi:hypothetical protein
MCSPHSNRMQDAVLRVQTHGAVACEVGDAGVEHGGGVGISETVDSRQILFEGKTAFRRSRNWPLNLLKRVPQDLLITDLRREKGKREGIMWVSRGREARGSNETPGSLPAEATRRILVSGGGKRAGLRGAGEPGP